ncbi:hypothetical protein [Kordiimonas sp.]|uniref:hypothetical protein n=1 Tax=Kordiimonas sp. TaxID=1970157 RepID=UPI003A8CEB12
MLAARHPSLRIIEAGLSEPRVNATGHGNQEIGAEEKAALLEQDRLLEQIEPRLGLKPYPARKITITFSKPNDDIGFLIKDRGKGFGSQHYFSSEPATRNQPLGRRILLARKISFDHLMYTFMPQASISRLTSSRKIVVTLRMRSLES